MQLVNWYSRHGRCFIMSSRKYKRIWENIGNLFYTFGNDIKVLITTLQFLWFVKIVDGILRIDLFYFTAKSLPL